MRSACSLWRLLQVFSFFNLGVIPHIAGAGSNPSVLLQFALLCTCLGRLGLAAAMSLPPTLTILASYLVLNLGQGMVRARRQASNALLILLPPSGIRAHTRVSPRPLTLAWSSPAHLGRRRRCSRRSPRALQARTASA